MKTIELVLGVLLLCCISCKKEPLSYEVSLDEGKPLISEIWKKGGANSSYSDMRITDQHYVFAAYENDTVLQVFDKQNPSDCIDYEIKSGDEKQSYSIDFIESNTRYESGENDVFLVENKRKVRQLRLQSGSLVTVKDELLPFDATQSTSYNFTKDEMYGVPIRGSLSKSFYFFQPDSGYYWIEMPWVLDRHKRGIEKLYKRNPYAFLSNLCVNEKKNAIVCGYFFFNQIHFFDLRGEVVRMVTVGNENIMPRNNVEGSLNYENSVKCVIDICSTDRHVYCLYDGSKDFDKTSQIFVFNWDGTYVKTYLADRIIKNIAVDSSNNKLIALASNEQNSRDVVSYIIE